jgi:peptidoglycan/LPS O-acetylase OafA/YrhL
LHAALQYTWTGLFYTSVLTIALLDGRSLVARVARWRFLRECGRISYCFYLIHLGILGLCHWIFFRSLPHIDDLPGFGVTLLAVAVTWVIAQLSWKFFEKPLIDLGRTRTYSPR